MAQDYLATYRSLMDAKTPHLRLIAEEGALSIVRRPNESR